MWSWIVRQWHAPEPLHSWYPRHTRHSLQSSVPPWKLPVANLHPWILKFHLTHKCHHHALLLLHTLPSSSAELWEHHHIEPTLLFVTQDTLPSSFIFLICSISLFLEMKLSFLRPCWPNSILHFLASHLYPSYPFPYSLTWIYDAPLIKLTFTSLFTNIPHLLTLCFYLPYSFHFFLLSFLLLPTTTTAQMTLLIFHTIAFQPRFTLQIYYRQASPCYTTLQRSPLMLFPFF